MDLPVSEYLQDNLLQHLIFVPGTRLFTVHFLCSVSLVRKRSKNLGLFVGDYYMLSSNGMVLYKNLKMTWEGVV
jgi:hypothetical protein